MNITRNLQKVILLIIITFTISCKKTEIPATYVEYVGTWISNNAELVINQNGTGSYNNILELMQVNGRLEFKQSEIIIRTGFFKKKLKINKPPYKEDMGAEIGIVTGLFYDKMVVENEDFIKMN
jgi:hypothetical protein